MIEPGGTVAPSLRLTGKAAEGLADRGNELAGVIFDPAGERLYFSAQRAFGFGAIYEVTGPFATGTAAPAPKAGRAAATQQSRLRVHAPRRISLAALRRRGVPVTVRTDSRARISVALRTDDLHSVPGKRGSDRRPFTVTLTRRRFRGAGRRLRLRVSAREARALRAATLQVVVTARFADGVTRVAVQRVRVR